jgi:hypothetical protein
MRLLLWSSVLLSISGAATLHGSEPITAAQIISDASSYQLHSVTLKGTVRQVEIHPPCMIMRKVCIRLPYTFLLEDLTGLIPVLTYCFGQTPTAFAVTKELFRGFSGTAYSCLARSMLCSLGQPSYLSDSGRQ